MEINLIQNEPLYVLNYSPSITDENNNIIESQYLESTRELTNELIVIAKYGVNEKITFKCRSLEYENKIFLAPLPNPVHILLNCAIENYNKSFEVCF